MSFNPNDYVTPYVTLEEVLEIKKAFDLFDRDLGGAIDPRGTHHFIQNSKLPSTLSELRPRHRQSIK
jgi:Ca2+-binding EF-hand superfamily protein